MKPIFLSVADVLELHALQLERFGGGEGVRDRGLLESAIAQPSAGYGGEFFHADLVEMAAAYLFHIVRNHPFVDGNKRVGLLAALVFLDLNGHPVLHATDTLYDITLRTAEGSMTKPQIAQSLRSLVAGT